MNKSAVVILVLGAIVAVLYVTYNSSENFWNLPARAVKVERVFTNDGVDFWQTPNFQGNLSPRFSNVNYGPYIKANLPSYNNMAVPSHPLGGGKDIVQGGTVDISEGFNFDTSGVTDPITGESTVMGLVPAKGGLLATYKNGNGEQRQAISFNRYMYANKQSRLRAAGDPFRGDLPIVPATGNWFVPSVHPNIDLQAGALNVMGGVTNNTNHQLSRLIYATSGGTDSTIGGVDLAYPGERNGFAQMNNISAMSGGADVTVTSFP